MVFSTKRPQVFRQDFRSGIADRLLASGLDSSPVQSPLQGVGRLSQALVGALLQKRAQEDRTAAQRALIKGLSAKPFTDPDTGITAPGQDVGGLSGGIAALQNLGGNPVATNLAQSLAIQKAAQDAEQRRLDRKSILDREESDRNRMLDRQDFLFEQENKRNPSKLLSDEELEQQIELRQAGRPVTTINTGTLSSTGKLARDAEVLPEGSPGREAALRELEQKGRSKPKPLTDAQSKAAGFANRVEAANEVLLKFDVEAADPAGALLERLPGGNFLQTPEFQQMDRARRDFINAILRRESGAVISASEFENANIQYFPVPGDGPDVIEAKREARSLELQNLRNSADPGFQPSDVQPNSGPLTPEEQRELDQLRKEFGR